MQPTSSRNTYRKRSREARGALTETGFGTTMTYTDNPIMGAKSRLLVNYIQKDFGTRARPRGGYRKTIDELPLGAGMVNPYVHHTGITLVTNTVTGDTAIRRYSLIVSDPGPLSNYVDVAGSKIVIEIPYDRQDVIIAVDEEETTSTYLVLSNNVGSPYAIRHNPRGMLVKNMGILVDAPTPIGVHTSVASNTYLLTDQGLGRLEVSVSAGVYTHGVALVEPTVVNPTTAQNYGYNMLLDTPYLFDNVETVEGRITGAIPYDAVETTRVKLHARLGERVLFRATYEYKTGINYRFKWEMQSITGTTTTEVLQTAEASPNYADGADASIEVVALHKQFSIIVTMYEAANLAEPIWVLEIPSYTLVEDDGDSARPADNFDFKTATQMASWKGQVVMWGVDNAETGLFMSSINNPTEFPYPHNFVDMAEIVVYAEEMMDSLAVLTENSLFLVGLMEDGYTVRKVQSNLQVRSQDIHSIKMIRNMIYLQSGKYFYMIVPDLRNDQGNLQLAPITEPITMLLDNFKSTTYEVIDDLYDLKTLMNANTSQISFKLKDVRCVLDGSRVRNMYLIELKTAAITRYITYQLIYDTIFRSWTIEIVETPKSGMQLFQSLSTGYAQYLTIAETAAGHSVECVRVDESNVLDDVMLDQNKECLFTNQQLLDTGKRALNGDLKKRFRSIILEMNNLQNEELDVNHLFFIDDMERSDLFNYDVVHITDPTDPNYGTLYVEKTYTAPGVVEAEHFVEKTYTEPDTLPGTTKLNKWKLSTSQFPDVTVVKVHMNVSGKGYYPRLRIITRQPKLFELNGITWVWRTMNAR